MGISFNPSLRAEEPKKFGGIKPEETQGVPTTTGFQANAGQFNIALNGNAGAPSVGGMKPSSSNPLQVAGTKPIRPDTQVAPGNKDLQPKLAVISSRERTPTVCEYNNNWMKDYYA